MKNWQSLVLGLVIGGVLGFGLFQTLDSGTVTAGVQPTDLLRVPGDDAEAPDRATTLVGEREPVASALDSDAREEVHAPEAVLITPALWRYAEEGLAKGWSSARADAIPPEAMKAGREEFEETVLEAPRRIGHKLAEHETAREEALADARTGGVFALLERLDAGGAGPVVGTVRDRGTFEAFFQRDSPETFVDGTSASREPAGIVAGSTLTFPAGVFEVKDLINYWRSEVPRDVTLAGAGMNSTLLVITDLSTREALRNFRLRDCTVFNPRDGVFDLRVQPALVRFDEVRVIGFDTGAGGSSALNTRGLAFHAVNCRFEGGYGSAPWSGSLLDVRTDALIARFDNCSFERMELQIRHIRPGATVMFFNCAMVDLFDHQLESDVADHAGVLLEHCSIQLFAGESGEAPSLDLNDLFPDWQARLQK